MSLLARAPHRAEHELYGVMGDRDTYKQLTRPTSEFETLGRYPSFHPPGGSTGVGSNPTGDVSSSSYLSPASAAGQTHLEPSQHRRSPRSRPSEPEHEAYHKDRGPDEAEQSWFNPKAEVWKPKKSASNKVRTSSPPSRPAPQYQSHSAPTPVAPLMYAYGSPLPPHQQPLTGILINEPDQAFARTRGPPRKSAMKTPGQQSSPLPNTAYLVPSSHPTQAPRQPAGILSPPSTVTNLSVNPPPTTASWISAPATSAGQRSAANSHYGSSTGTSSVAFTSSSYYSNSGPRSSTRDRIPPDEDSPIEPTGPRQTLFVVNPDAASSEKSFVVDRKPFVPVLPGNPNKTGSRRKHKLSDAPMPPVPPLPPQFQPPPPPNYPPPGDRARNDLVVPHSSNSRSGHDRDRSSASKRNKTDGRSQPSSSNPIPIPPDSKLSTQTPGSGGSRSTHHHHHHQSRHSESSSSGDDGSSSSSSQQRYGSSSKVTHPASAEGSIPPEWIYPLPLTLEELFKGGQYTYRITTRLLSGEPKIQEVQIDVKPGWKTGTRIIFPDAGNERTPGAFQTMIFVVEQVHHERFTRLDAGRLVYNENIDLVEALKENGRREMRKVLGLDGKVIEFYPPRGVINPGQETVIKGEGMHTRSKSKVVGRGDLIIRWNIKFPDQVTPDQVNRMRDIFKQ